MRFKHIILITLTFLIIGCDGSYESNDDEMISEMKQLFVAVGESGTIITVSYTHLTLPTKA